MPNFKQPRFLMHRRLLTAAGLLSGFLFIFGCGSQPPEKPVATSQQQPVVHELTVAAAADLKFVLGEIITEFESQNPQIKVTPTFGASGNLYSQLVNQAPFDLYLSADRSYPEKLVDQDLADQATLFFYAVGQIVVWAPKNSPLQIESSGIDVLNDSSVQKIAIANPKHAPYGRAAEAAIKASGLYDQVAERLVLGENVAQAAQFIESGAADVGLIALSLAAAPALRDKGRYWVVPQSVYPPIEQAGVIVKWTRELEAAQQFRAFLMSDQAQAILKNHGFQTPTSK